MKLLIHFQHVMVQSLKFQTLVVVGSSSGNSNSSNIIIIIIITID